MPTKTKKMTYAVEQRLRFIDFLLHQYGHINRSALMDYFGISTPQASADISAYIRLAPDNVHYNKTWKRYNRANDFKRLWK